VARRGPERREAAGVARVLLVEGQPAVRGGLRRVLSSAGHEVIEAHEGHAGLTFSGETPADAVVVNLTLPDMDGVEFIRQLRCCCPSSKVVAIGGRRPYGAPDPLAIATRIGDVRGLRWPFPPNGLISAVAEVLKDRN
jgi:CheY-like chemotaxis protein